MLERFERPLRIACVVLGALVLVQLGLLAFRKNPLDQLKIPALPTYTNTNAPTGAKSTNAVASKVSDAKGTNSVAQAEGEKKSTNSVASNSTNVLEAKTNLLATQTAIVGATNNVAKDNRETNSPTAESKNTNGVSAALAAEMKTNSISGTNGATKDTNSIAFKDGDKKPNNDAMAKAMARAMGGMPGGPGGKSMIELPPAIQARVDKITQSEILAQVMRPMPMALLGIAGNSAFLRSTSGQSGLVKEGDELGGIKLLKIGTNRVLVEEAGEKKELMVFSGFGGESLLPKEKEQKEIPK